jgi:hypothetical protein
LKIWKTLAKVYGIVLSCQSTHHGEYAGADGREFTGNLQIHNSWEKQVNQ